jgi:DNA-binding response OmpR family regulator
MSEKSEINPLLPTKDILLIEDDPDLRDVVIGVLQKLKYEVLACDSFDDAVNLLLTFRFSLVISDINLGASSGLDVLSWIKQNAPISRVVLMTGYLEDTDIHDALELGVFGFMAKPISKKEIKKIVKNALSKNSEDRISDIDYARIDLEDFLTGKVLNFPVYIRLKDSRFLKIAHSGTEIDSDRLNMLNEKGIHELWIDKEDLPSYLSLNEKILKAKNTWSPEVKVKLLNHLAEINHESMRLLKMSSDSLRRSMDSLHYLTNEISKIEGTFPLITPFFTSEQRASKFAVLGTSFSLMVAKILDWTADKTLQSLAIGAFFRDVSLSMEEFDYSLIFQKGAQFDRNQYKGHPERSADILAKIKGLPQEAINIALQHHEHGGQSAFPNGLPRSRVFAPALLVAYVERMLTYMAENSEVPPEKLRASLVRYLSHELGTADDKATALILLLEKGDVNLAKREFERLKKLGGR